MSNDTRKRPDRWNGRRGRPRPSTNGGSAAKRNGRHGDVRAHAKRNYERYIELAQAAISAGDAIEGENLYQHAEHYFRTMKEYERGRDGDKQADRGA